MTKASIKRKISVLTLFLFLLPFNVIAQATKDNHDISFTAALVRTGAALLLVLALIFFVVYLMKRFLPSITGNVMAVRDFKKDKIEIISSRSLGPKKSLYIIKADGRRFLISSTDNVISLLSELEKAEEEIKQESSEKSPEV